MPIRESLLEVFFRHDPVGLAAIGAHKDEYWPEVQDLIPRLNEVGSEEELRTLIHEIFVGKSGGGPTSDAEAAFTALAREIWTRFVAGHQADWKPWPPD